MGSTGSIGTQALEVVRCLNRSGDFPVQIVALSAKSSIDLLEEQAREFMPEVVAVYEDKKAELLKERLSDSSIKVVSGMDGLCEIATLKDVEVVLNAVVGMIGLRPTLEAIKAKKDIALANKETLVASGALMMNEARQNEVKLLPVDSEHSAIFQCLQGSEESSASGKALKKLILTASGGPFFGKSIDELKSMKASDALKHPNWDMGAKITIDSATMMNKGLEIIEASWLFDMPVEKIDVVVHRESIVHSLIEYDDNSVIAQLGLPDMTIPIQYALTYPSRFPSPAGELKLSELKNLSFYEPDYETFKCMKSCIEALKCGGLMPAMVNGANEEAVALFLEDKIGFVDIGDIVESILKQDFKKGDYTLEDVITADQAAREHVKKYVTRNLS